MSLDHCTRRSFLKRGAHAVGGVALASSVPVYAWMPTMKPKFEISIAAWSFHRMFYAGKLKQIDMPKVCREEFDISGLELVNSFFPSPQYNYCKDLLKRANDLGVKILLIMCDGEGDMSHPDKKERDQAIRQHRKWLDVAAVLGCHSIRCNTGKGGPEDDDAHKRCAESFAKLVELARPDKINVIIENHWNFSSYPDALVKVIKQVNDPLFGTLPDFGNFPEEVNRYDAVRKMMPFAKAVSAKCHNFDVEGNETGTDYARMMKIVLDAGYSGYVGIEYEGPDQDEYSGIRKCQKLLQRFQ